MCVDVIDVDAVEEPYEFEVFDVHKCFREFNDLCFDSTLEAVCVSWSKRLTLSAGKCQFKVGIRHSAAQSFNRANATARYGLAIRCCGTAQSRNAR